MKIVERIDERGRRATIIFRRDEDKGVSAFYDLTPRPGVRVFVLPQARMPLFVKKGKIHLGQINKLDVELVMRAGVVSYPRADQRATPALAGGSNNHLQIQ